MHGAFSARIQYRCYVHQVAFGDAAVQPIEGGHHAQDSIWSDSVRRCRRCSRCAGLGRTRRWRFGTRRDGFRGRTQRAHERVASGPVGSQRGALEFPRPVPCQCERDLARAKLARQGQLEFRARQRWRNDVNVVNLERDDEWARARQVNQNSEIRKGQRQEIEPLTPRLGPCPATGRAPCLIQAPVLPWQNENSLRC
jgi:hypothetical protein